MNQCAGWINMQVTMQRPRNTNQYYKACTILSTYKIQPTTYNLIQHTLLLFSWYFFFLFNGVPATGYIAQIMNTLSFHQ